MRSRSNGADSVKTLNEDNEENMDMEGAIQRRFALSLMRSPGSYSSSQTPFRFPFAHHDWDSTSLAYVNITNQAYHMFSPVPTLLLTVIYQQHVSLWLSLLILPEF